MKKIFILYKLLFLCLLGYGQFTISSGTTLKTTGGVTIVLNDMNLNNDGTINQASGEGGFRFTGTQNASITGTSLPAIGILEVNKTNGSKLMLNRNININSFISFISGQLDLNNNNIVLTPTAYIAGESDNNRVSGVNGGYVEITQNMNAPASVNAGNLGATITSSANLGSVIIRRGHTAQSGTGLANSINRYFSILPSNNSSLNATLRLRYFDSELNGQNEAALVMYQSNNGGTDWNNLSQSSRNANSNYVEKTGLGSLSLQTLANDNIIAEDGVTDLVFTGTRKKSTEVQLNWTSQTETNMNGYQVQRKLDNEVDFSDRTFVNSLAPGGNSLSSLSYQNIDANSYTDTSYYRLKIMTTNNTFTYSNIVTIAPKTKGGGSNAGGGNGGGGHGGGGNPHNNTTTADTLSTVAAGVKSMQQPVSLVKKITVGPNPNNGYFWFNVSGIENVTTATLYSIDGKMLKQYRINNMQQVQVQGLKNGIYLLKVKGMDASKILVQGAATGSSNQNLPGIPPVKNLD